MCCNVIIRIKQRVSLTSAAQAATNQPWASAQPHQPLVQITSQIKGPTLVEK